MSGKAGQFLVWCPDRGETEEDAEVFFNLNFTHRDVAEKWAERDFNTGDPWSVVTIMVREGTDSEPRRMDVTVETVPVFTASFY
jgi:hypothetical protein